MHVTMVHVYVSHEHIRDFISATQINHQASVIEPGNCRFDVLQSAADPAYFVLYEAYASAKDVAVHKQTAHYLKWRETVADWMTVPRRGDVFQALFPVVDGSA